LIRLASELQTLRAVAETKQMAPDGLASEALSVWSPLANRLGLWPLKWEIEDLAFRFSEPLKYKEIAKQLEEKRTERAVFIDQFGDALKGLLSAKSFLVQISGRPKHIYSIYKKMLSKNVALAGLSDLHAFRVLVDSVHDCYGVLAAVHERWSAITSEYDDYIARPKPNGYRSLHTVVLADDGRAVEVQIRTHEMHQFAEFGVASHWRYKEAMSGAMDLQSKLHKKKTGADSQELRVEAMRQLLGWKNDLAGATALPESTHVYAMTPQGRVIELPKGSTAIDFAYHVHTDLGHRCRGAKIDGHLFPLTTPLQNGQTVDIVAVKSTDVSPATALLKIQANIHGARVGPSRDWLNPQLGFLVSARAKTKVRQWFNAFEEARVNSAPPESAAALVTIDEPVSKAEEAKDLLESLNKPSRTLNDYSKGRVGSDVLVVGVDFLMTQLAKCCRPLPPDEISGFVTRGNGISIHRKSCKTFLSMAAKSAERVLPSAWGSIEALGEKGRIYPVDVLVQAYDRQGLLRDISDTLAREKINVIGASTQSKDQVAYMRFTVEVPNLHTLQKALKSVTNISSVFDAKRRI
jgi:GTP pyrophosphokinase